MTKTQNTKRMFVTSTIAMIMCIAMLIGSTFAWFTDTKSASVNSIQAGTLKIDIQDEASNTLVGEPLNFVKAAGHESEPVLWEPGSTYNLVPFKVVSQGNLALKFKVQITGLTGDAKLLEAIDFTMNGQPIADFEGKLAPAAATELYTISGHMKETAGNEYQGLTLDGIAITVVATQDTVEYDSNNNTYDANATYPVVDLNSFKTSIANGGNLVLAAPVEMTYVSGESGHIVPQTEIKKDAVIDLNGQEIKASADSASMSVTGNPVLMAITDPINVVFNGDGVINTEAGDNGAYCLNVNNKDAVVTVNGGKWFGAPTGIQVQAGTLNVTGGFFDLAPTCKNIVPQYANYEINCIDSAFRNGSAKINVTGGTFVNFDPSANPEGEGTSYVAEGYTVTSEVHGDDTWYTVVPATV